VLVGILVSVEIGVAVGELFGVSVVVGAVVPVDVSVAVGTGV